MNLEVGSSLTAEIAKEPPCLCNYAELVTPTYSEGYIRKWASSWVPPYLLTTDALIGEPINATYYNELLVISNCFTVFQRLEESIFPIDSYSSTLAESYHRQTYGHVHNLEIDFLRAQEDEIAHYILPRGKVGFLLLWHQDHSNYWHFTFDIAFRLFYILSIYPSLASRLEIIAVGCDRLKPFQMQIIEAIMGSHAKVICSPTSTLISSSIFIAPTQSVLPRKQWLQAYSSFLKHGLSNTNVISKSTKGFDKSSVGKHKRVYISRGNAKNPRFITNEKCLVSLLQMYGFSIHDPGTLTVSEQACLFSDADFIIGAHGSAFVNMLYMKNPATVIEITSSEYDPFHDFLLARQLGLTFIRLRQSLKQQMTGLDHVHHRPFEVDLKIVTRLLDRLDLARLV